MLGFDYKMKGKHMIPEAIIVRPKSAINRYEVIKSFLIEADESRSEIRLYGVGTRGAIYTYIIEPMVSRIILDNDANLTLLECKMEISTTTHSSVVILENYGITAFQDFVLSEFALFDSKVAAEKYSEYLKSNEIYMRYITAWEAYTSSLMDKILRGE